MNHNIHRLLYIEALLITNQIITRRHLTTTFLIGNATASRDIADYRKLIEGNMLFQLSPKKSWSKTIDFEPLFFMADSNSTIEQPKVQEKHGRITSKYLQTCTVPSPSAVSYSVNKGEIIATDNNYQLID